MPDLRLAPRRVSSVSDYPPNCGDHEVNAKRLAFRPWSTPKICKLSRSSRFYTLFKGYGVRSFARSLVRSFVCLFSWSKYQLALSLGVWQCTRQITSPTWDLQWSEWLLLLLLNGQSSPARTKLSFRQTRFQVGNKGNTILLSRCALPLPLFSLPRLLLVLFPSIFSTRSYFILKPRTLVTILIITIPIITPILFYLFILLQSVEIDNK